MGHIRIPYGKGYQEAELPDNWNVEIVDPPAVPAEKPESIYIREALDHPIGTPRLEEMVSGRERVVIVMNDQTRPGPNAEIAAQLVERLKKAGVSENQILFEIATGSHKGPDAQQLHTILGGLEERIQVHINDCQDKSHMFLGNTNICDVPVYIDRVVAEADFVITTGLIAPHQSAGFSGGRKSILPGVASMDTLKIHHSLRVRPFEPSINRIEDNPFHVVALEAARMANVRFILNVVMDPHKQVCGAVAGDLDQAHMAGVELCRKTNTVDVHGRADLIITSPGGAPRDLDLWQSQKALSAAELLYDSRGCTFILVAEAKNGIPQLFIDWMKEAKTPQDVIDRYRREGFGIGSNKAFMYARCMQKGRIILVSEGLSKEALAEVKLDWAPSLQEAVRMASEEHKPRKVIVLPRAINLIPNIIE